MLLYTVPGRGMIHRVEHSGGSEKKVVSGTASTISAMVPT